VDQIRDLRFHYREWGDPNSPGLVLLHGLRGSSEVWWTVRTALHDSHLIALDHRGRGGSDWGA
jgi:pimeloyl-ACP methyl ester carboxylesterase